MNKKEIIDLMLKQEGFYNNNFGYVSKNEAEKKGDNGGETYAGIARKSHPDWEGWNIIDKTDGLPDLTDMVIDFYDKKYYSKIETSNENVNKILLSASVNCGVKNAVKFFQTAINLHNNGGKRTNNLVTDGVLGKLTLAGFEDLNDRHDAIVESILIEWGKYYHRLDFPQFITGWINRIIHTREMLS